MVKNFTFLFTFIFLPFLLLAQNTLIGKIVDENKEGLFSANVFITELSKGGVTNFDGVFEIKNIPDGSYNVKVTYLGYKPINQSVSFANGETKSLPISMERDAEVLDDVVVIGYGVLKKREVVGSISKISSEDVSDALGNSFDANLQGKAAGVQVIQSSGIAGSGARIRVRGTGAISSGGDPLYVVDGVAIFQDPNVLGSGGGQNYNPLSTINPNDIESIEILKDASATAIYGSRGANGVVIITTKKGKGGKPTFNYRATVGLSQPAVNVADNYVTTEEYLQLYQEAWENDGNVGLAPFPGLDSPQDLDGQEVDWFDELTQTGVTHEHNLSMSMGKPKFNTYLGFTYLNTESYQVDNSFERISGRGNFGYNPNKKLGFILNSSISRGLNNRVSQAWDGGLGFAESVLLPYYSVDSFEFDNGVRNPAFKTALIDWNTLEMRTINKLTVNYSPIEDLTLSASYGMDYINLRNSRLEDSVWTNSEVIAKLEAKQIYTYNTNVLATYTWDTLADHKLTTLVGYEYWQSMEDGSDREVQAAMGHLYATEEVYDTSFQATDNNKPFNGKKFTSQFVRFNYGFKSKLLAQFSYRIDGSSVFGSNEKFGHFPALGLAYIISEEAFLKESQKISFLKVKASVGRTGNDQIDYAGQFGGYGSTLNSYNNTNSNYYDRLDNPDLKWETNLSFDGGFEMGFLKDRITTELNFYNKLTQDAIIDFRVPTSTGQKQFAKNVAKIVNRGVEFQITSRNIVKNNFVWKTDFNITHNKNKVLDVANAPPDALQGAGDTRVVEGSPIGVNYLVRFSHVDPATGLPVFLDKDGLETMEWDEDNRVEVGNVQPIVSGGIGNTFTIRNNLVIDVLGTFSLGGNIYDDAAKRQLGIVTDWIMQRDILDRWQQPGDISKYPRLTLDPTTYGGLSSEWSYNTTQYLYNASYFRIKKLAIGYKMPKKLFTNVKGLGGVAFNFTAINLLTFSAYNRDPEVVRDQTGRQGANLSPNVTYLTPPQQRTFSFGINVDFK